jgi:hypothetical protein
MKYESPEVLRVGAAVIIEGQQPKRGAVLEGFPLSFLTAPSYKADK